MRGLLQLFGFDSDQRTSSSGPRCVQDLKSVANKVLWRLDKEEYASAFSIVKSNLYRLLFLACVFLKNFASFLLFFSFFTFLFVEFSIVALFSLYVGTRGVGDDGPPLTSNSTYNVTRTQVEKRARNSKAKSKLQSKDHLNINAPLVCFR